MVEGLDRGSLFGKSCAPGRRHPSIAAYLKFGIFCRIFVFRSRDAMPTVKDFGAYKVTLYAADHNPPHVHIIGPDFQAEVPHRRCRGIRRSNPAVPPPRGIVLDSGKSPEVAEKWNELN